MEPTTATFFDLVRDQMVEVEARMRRAPADSHPNLDLALDHLLSSGGKRIRPTVVLLVSNLLGADSSAAISLAAAIEMLHTATLVHDDLIDGSLVRRGIPTLNAQWSPGATVLTGDFIFARAAHLASQTGSLAVMEAFARTLMTIVNGEIVQLFGADGADPKQDYYKRIYAKTASLFELAAEGSALLANCEPNTIQAIKSFGYSTGVAFQIIDDVLDFTSDQDRLGKPVGSDLRQGLITLPALLYFEAHAKEDPRSFVERHRSSPEAMENVIQAIRQSDAVEVAMAEARRFVDEALAQLPALPAAPERQALHQLARYIVQRSL